MSLEGKQLHHYRLLHLIGKGGMGEVYLAEDLSVRRQVAISNPPIIVAIRAPKYTCHGSAICTAMSSGKLQGAVR